MAITTSGKDKLLIYTRVYWNGYDVSGSSRTFGSIVDGYNEHSMWSLDETIDNFLLGRHSSRLTGYQALMDDTATSGTWTLGKTPGDNTSRQLSVVFGGGGAPAVGDPAYHIPALQSNSPTSWDSGTAVFQADFIPDAAQYDANTTRLLGVCLHPQATTLSATLAASSTNSFDFGASSAAGFTAVLHVLTTASGNFTFTIEHSSDDSAFSTLGTFSADGSAVTSEYLTGSGTVNRYVAFQAARTAGTVTAVVTFARN